MCASVKWHPVELDDRDANSGSPSNMPTSCFLRLHGRQRHKQQKVPLPPEDYNYKLACLHPIKMFPCVYSLDRQPWSIAMIFTAGYSTSPLRRGKPQTRTFSLPKRCNVDRLLLPNRHLGLEIKPRIKYNRPPYFWSIEKQWRSKEQWI